MNRARKIIILLIVISIVPFLFTYATGIGRNFGLIEFGFFAAVLIATGVVQSYLISTHQWN